MKSVNLYLMVGASGSGKSTWARNKAVELNAEIVATDEIRRIQFDDETTQAHNREVFELAQSMVRSNLTKGKNVIFDATNLRAAHRLDFLSKVLPENNTDFYYVVTYVFMDTSREDCIRRQALRDRRVPQQVVDRQWKSMEPLQGVEYALEIHVK